MVDNEGYTTSLFQTISSEKKGVECEERASEIVDGMQ
jgi:hypothetical protein